jgi:hypothetical protein
MLPRKKRKKFQFFSGEKFFAIKEHREKGRPFFLSAEPAARTKIGITFLKKLIMLEIENWGN